MYFVFAKCEADFVYKVTHDMTCYALNYQFIHNDLFSNGRFKE